MKPVSHSRERSHHKSHWNMECRSHPRSAHRRDRSRHLQATRRGRLVQGGDITTRSKRRRLDRDCRPRLRKAECIEALVWRALRQFPASTTYRAHTARIRASLSGPRSSPAHRDRQDWSHRALLLAQELSTPRRYKSDPKVRSTVGRHRIQFQRRTFRFHTHRTADRWRLHRTRLQSPRRRARRRRSWERRWKRPPGTGGCWGKGTPRSSRSSPRRKGQADKTQCHSPARCVLARGTQKLIQDGPSSSPQFPKSQPGRLGLHSAPREQSAAVAIRHKVPRRSLFIVTPPLRRVTEPGF